MCIETWVRRYGGGAEVGRVMIAKVSAVAAGAGLTFGYEDAQRAGTVDACTCGPDCCAA